MYLISKPTTFHPLHPSVYQFCFVPLTLCPRIDDNASSGVMWWANTLINWWAPLLPTQIVPIPVVKIKRVESSGATSSNHDPGVKDDECIICFGERDPPCVLVSHEQECGHANFCLPCGRRLANSAPKQCPVCRAVIYKAVQLRSWRVKRIQANVKIWR